MKAGGGEVKLGFVCLSGESDRRIRSMYSYINVERGLLGYTRLSMNGRREVPRESLCL